MITQNTIFCAKKCIGLTAVSIFAERTMRCGILDIIKLMVLDQLQIPKGWRDATANKWVLTRVCCVVF